MLQDQNSKVFQCEFTHNSSILPLSNPIAKSFKYKQRYQELLYWSQLSSSVRYLRSLSSQLQQSIRNGSFQAFSMKMKNASHWFYGYLSQPLVMNHSQCLFYQPKDLHPQYYPPDYYQQLVYPEKKPNKKRVSLNSSEVKMDSSPAERTTVLEALFPSMEILQNLHPSSYQEPTSLYPPSSFPSFQLGIELFSFVSCPYLKSLLSSQYAVNNTVNHIQNLNCTIHSLFVSCSVSSLSVSIAIPVFYKLLYHVLRKHPCSEQYCTLLMEVLGSSQPFYSSLFPSLQQISSLFEKNKNKLDPDSISIVDSFDEIVVYFYYIFVHSQQEEELSKPPCQCGCRVIWDASTWSTIVTLLTNILGQQPLAVCRFCVIDRSSFNLQRICMFLVRPV